MASAGQKISFRRRDDGLRSTAEWGRTRARRENGAIVPQTHDRHSPTSGMRHGQPMALSLQAIVGCEAGAGRLMSG